MAETARARVLGEEHEALRETVGRFVDAHVADDLPRWEADGVVPRELYRRAGEAGLLGPSVPVELGGGGVEDPRTTAVIAEELCYRGAPSVAMNLCGFSDLVAPYLVQLGTPEQQDRWLPPLCRGEAISAIAMTEPDAGSDLRSIATTATPTSDGYRLSGAKALISNGSRADLLVVAARVAGSSGLTLLLVDGDAPGVTRGRPLAKIGLHAQDTVELAFDEVDLPADAVLGEVGAGLHALKRNLAHERVTVAWMSLGTMRRVVDQTLAHVRDRRAFGGRLANLQAVRFQVAEMAAEVETTESLLLAQLADHADGRLSGAQAAMGKWWASEAEQRVASRGVQLHGGYGYLLELDVARAFRDARASTLYAGATEVMKEIVGRSLLGDGPPAPAGDR